MVYQIYYGNDRPRQILFDIDYYLALVKEKCATTGMWYVEINVISSISGATDFLFKQFNNSTFNIDQFKKDCYELEELRGWLWETHNNKPRTKELASKDENEWGKYIEKKITQFADKYGLCINMD